MLPLGQRAGFTGEQRKDNRALYRRSQTFYARNYVYSNLHSTAEKLSALSLRQSYVDVQLLDECRCIACIISNLQEIIQKTSGGNRTTETSKRYNKNRLSVWASGGGKGHLPPGFWEYFTKISVLIILVFNNKWLRNYQNGCADI